MTDFPDPPPQLERLAQLIGAEACFLLIEARAGTRVFVPKNAGRADILTEIIGPEATAKLSREYGGMNITLPMARGWRVQVWHRRGLSAPKIALRVGCGERKVWEILKGARERSLQMDMFEAS
jgi:hypothetical protein